MAQSSRKTGTITVWVGVVCGLILIAVKILLGIIGKSHALIADAFHSISDFLTDILAFFGVLYAFKGEDKDHPFGHGKIDTLMSLLIGIVMVLTGIWLGYEAATNIITGDLSRPNVWALMGAVISILVKEALFRYTHYVGIKIGNQSLIANAYHHRSDVLSSLAVVVGVIPAVINPDWAVFDALAVIVVAGMIAKMGFEVVIPAFRHASDAAPSDEQIEEIKRVAASVEGARNPHDIKARFYSNKLYTEVHIAVDPNITVQKGHEIADMVRDKIMAEIDDILGVIVHVDPDDENN